MASNPLTWLQHAGSVIVGLFKKAAPVVDDVVKGAAELGQIAQPIVDLAFPTVAPLYNLTESAILQAEATGQSILSSTSGGGSTKLTAVINGLEPIFAAYYKQTFGSTPTLAQIEAYINAVVASLNALPAPSSSTQPVAPTTAAKTATTPAPATATVAPLKG